MVCRTLRKFYDISEILAIRFYDKNNLADAFIKLKSNAALNRIVSKDKADFTIEQLIIRTLKKTASDVGATKTSHLIIKNQGRSHKAPNVHPAHITNNPSIVTLEISNTTSVTRYSTLKLRTDFLRIQYQTYHDFRSHRK